MSNVLFAGNVLLSGLCQSHRMAQNADGLTVQEIEPYNPPCHTVCIHITEGKTGVCCPAKSCTSIFKAFCPLCAACVGGWGFGGGGLAGGPLQPS